MCQTVLRARDRAVNGDTDLPLMELTLQSADQAINTQTDK